MAEDKELKKAILLNDSILVKLLDTESETQNGIILPTDQHLEGEVVKTGPGVYTQSGKQIPLQVKVGDVVRLSGKSKSYQDVKLDGVKYKMANEREIVLVVER